MSERINPGTRRTPAQAPDRGPAPTAPRPPRSLSRRRPHTPPSPVGHTAFREVLRASGLIRRLSEPHLARYGVSPAQWGVLRALERLEVAGHPRPRMHELGDALLVRPPSLSATLERMEHAGLIAREPDQHDHRTRRVSFTRRGRELLARAQSDHARWIDRMMGALTTQQQTSLAELLGRLTVHLQIEAGAGEEPEPGVLIPDRPAASQAPSPAQPAPSRISKRRNR